MNGYITNNRLNLLFLLLPVTWWVSKSAFYWNNFPEYSFGYIILILTFFMFKTSNSKEEVKNSSVLSAFAIVFISLSLIGTSIIELYSYSIAETPVVGFCRNILMFVFVLSYIALIGGKNMVMISLAPMCFFMISTPIPEIISSKILINLQIGIANSVTNILCVLGYPCVNNGIMIISSLGENVSIEEGCSVVRGVQSCLMVSTFIGLQFFENHKKTLVLIVIGVLAALSANFFRTLLLSYLNISLGSNFVARFHDPAGWVVLIVTLMIVTLAAVVLKKLSTKNDYLKTTV